MENKIAICIENKSQFEAVKKWEKSRCYDFEYNNRFGYLPINGDGNQFTKSGLDGLPDDYDIVPFSVFSQLTGVIAEPEEVMIELGYPLKAIVKGNHVSFSHSLDGLTSKMVEEIYTAFKSLN